MLVNKQSRLAVRKYIGISFPRGPSMYGINYQLTMYMFSVIHCVQEQNRQVSR